LKTLDYFYESVKGEKQKTIAVPFANDPNVISSIAHAVKNEIAHFILIGEKDKIRAVADENQADVSATEIISESDEQKACNKAAELVRDGQAQVMIKGLVQSSSFIKAILNKQHDLVQPGKLISCVSLFELPVYHKLLLITDTAVNISPSLEVKVQILLNAIQIIRAIGIERPKAACVESVEKVNPKIPGTVDADKIKAMGETGFFGNVTIDGPLGFDAAVSRQAAEIKGLKSNVAGDPDILLLPELVAANVLYKSFVWCGSGKVASIVTGAKAPVVLTSRSDSEDTKFNSIALAIYLAGKNNSQ